MEKFPPMLLLLPAAALLCHAALHDIAVRTIPDLDSVLVAALGMTARFIHGQALACGMLAAAMLVVGQLVWSRGWIGGGDVKLIAACSCLVAPAGVPGLLGITLCAGGVLGLLYFAAGLMLPNTAMRRGVVLTGWRRIARLEAWRIRRHGPLPYGVAISAATLLLLLRPQGMS